MKKRLLDIIRCPACSKRLSLLILDEKEDELFLNSKESLYLYFQESHADFNNWADLHRSEITSGILHCDCGENYPVVDGVPRLLVSARGEYNAFYEKSRDAIPKEFQQNIFLPGKTYRAYHKSSKKGFELQWEQYEYDQLTWGKSLEVRKTEFLDNLRTSPDELKGRLVFDAGCGNGSLAAGIAPFGCEIVALDYTTSIERANKNKEKYAGRFAPFVHFIQADLAKLPIAERTFDYIHSSGVIHHTPDPYYVFKQFVKTVKKNDKVYILMYRKRKDLFGRLNHLERFITTRLSKKLLYRLCLSFSPLHRKFSATIRAICGEEPVVPMSNQELAIIMFDNYSPKYRFEYSLQELIDMYEREGVSFEEEVTHEAYDEKKHTIGILGIKR